VTRLLPLLLISLGASNIALAEGPPGASTPGASAPSAPPTPEARTVPAPAAFSLVLGGSLGWQYRRDFGNATRAALSPEILVGATMPSQWSRIYIRPAVRVGFTGLDQSEQPETIHIEERDIIGSLEVAAVYDGPVIPTLALGGGGMVRFVDLDVRTPLESTGDDISRTQTLSRIYVQAGVGLPLRRGLVVLEPSLRYEVVFGDDRIAWRGGVDITIGL